jgi:hypothetical protein
LKIETKGQFFLTIFFFFKKGDNYDKRSSIYDPESRFDPIGMPLKSLESGVPKKRLESVEKDVILGQYFYQLTKIKPYIYFQYTILHNK